MMQSRLFIRIVNKNREAYFLKIITLAVAFACSTLIILFSLNEFGYDEFHHDSNSVFRVLEKNTGESFSGNRLSTIIPSKVFESLKSNTDSLVVSRVKIMNELSIFTEKGVSHHQKIHAADFTLTTIFSFDLVDGSFENFNGNKTIILSASAAQQYFGTTTITGKTLKIQSVGDTVLFTVAAVFKDYPQNSHEAFHAFIRFDSHAIEALGFNAEESGVYGKTLHTSPLYGNFLMRSGDLAYTFQPLPEIYFGPRVTGEDAQHGDSYSIIILISMTSLIMFLALTNFVNLTT
jgi:putative ABC transport system permease protein